METDFAATTTPATIPPTRRVSQPFISERQHLSTFMPSFEDFENALPVPMVVPAVSPLATSAPTDMARFYEAALPDAEEVMMSDLEPVPIIGAVSNNRTQRKP